MSEDMLNGLPHDILRLTYKYIKENGVPPTRNNRYFEDETGRSGSQIGTIKKELRVQGYLDKNCQLTDKGMRYARQYFDLGPFEVRSAEIHVQGQVKASPTEDWAVAYQELDTPSSRTITIPSYTDLVDTFALQVTGPSMQKMGILDGDFVIVQKQQNLWWPRPQDMIIVRYLPHEPKRKGVKGVDPDQYIGPVLKVYIERFGEDGCRLGWGRSDRENPYMIDADHIIPIGRVTGLYRDLTQSPRIYSWI